MPSYCQKVHLKTPGFAAYTGSTDSSLLLFQEANCALAAPFTLLNFTLLFQRNETVKMFHVEHFCYFGPYTFKSNSL